MITFARLILAVSCLSAIPLTSIQTPFNRFFLCPHSETGTCRQCGPTHRVSTFPQQPGECTALSEIIIDFAGEDTGALWNGFINALIDYFAWIEGWMAERLAVVLATAFRWVMYPAAVRQIMCLYCAISIFSQMSAVPSFSIDQETGQTAYLDIPVSALGRQPVKPPSWRLGGESDAGALQRLWPSLKIGTHMRVVHLNDEQLQRAQDGFRLQFGNGTDRLLPRGTEWALMRLGPPMVGGEESMADDMDAVYCVWPLHLLDNQTMNTNQEESVELPSPLPKSKVSPAKSHPRDDGQAEYVDDVLEMFDEMDAAEDGFREAEVVPSDRPPPPSQAEREPGNRQPSLFDVSYWLALDRSTDTNTETIETPKAIQQPTPTPGAKHDFDILVQANHDSVDAISSKILSPTANPTPQPARDWDMNMPLWASQQEDNDNMLTEEDFDFFDAPHAAMVAMDMDNEAGMDVQMHALVDYEDTETSGLGISTEGMDSKFLYPEMAEQQQMDWDYTAVPTLPIYQPEPLPMAVEDEDVEMEMVGEPDAEVADDDSDDLFGDSDSSGDAFGEAQNPEESYQMDTSQDETRISHLDVTDDIPSPMPLPENIHAGLPLTIASAEKRPEAGTYGLFEMQAILATKGKPYVIGSRMSFNSFIPEDMSPLEFIGARVQPEIWMSSTFGLGVADHYGDGTVKNRKQYRASLRQLYAVGRDGPIAHRTGRILYDGLRSDGSDDMIEAQREDDGDSETSTEISDSESDAEAATADASAQRVIKHESFQLESYPWIAAELLASRAILEPLANSDPKTQKHTPQPPPASMLTAITRTGASAIEALQLDDDFRSWLQDVLVADANFRRWINPSFPPTTPADRLADLPRVRVRQRQRITDICGSAVALWKEMDLAPLGGPKRAELFVLFEPSHIPINEVQDWQRALEKSYSVSPLRTNATRRLH